jgi:hypothetical protein
MARLYRVGDFENYNITIPIPNDALEAFLVSPKCKEAVLEVAQQVYRAYVNLLPASALNPRVTGSGQRNLKRGARIGTKIDSRNGTPRHTAWVMNKALSYKPARGQPYPRAIEYGNPATGAPAGHQLRDAAAQVANGKVQAAARQVLGGMDGAQPGQARPAPRPVKKATPGAGGARFGGGEGFGNVTLQEREAIRRRREEEVRQRFQRRRPEGG